VLCLSIQLAVRARLSTLVVKRGAAHRVEQLTATVRTGVFESNSLKIKISAGV
jgi:hypothetical protein